MRFIPLPPFNSINVLTFPTLMCYYINYYTVQIRSTRKHLRYNKNDLTKTHKKIITKENM